VTDHVIATRLGGEADDRPVSEQELRAFLARIVGDERTETVESALRSLSLYATGRAALVLRGSMAAGSTAERRS